jgi:hypothetical protein
MYILVVALNSYTILFFYFCILSLYVGARRMEFSRELDIDLLLVSRENFEKFWNNAQQVSCFRHSLKFFFNNKIK